MHQTLKALKRRMDALMPKLEHLSGLYWSEDPKLYISAVNDLKLDAVEFCAFFHDREHLVFERRDGSQDESESVLADTILEFEVVIYDIKNASVFADYYDVNRAWDRFEEYYREDV